MHKNSFKNKFKAHSTFCIFDEDILINLCEKTFFLNVCENIFFRSIFPFFQKAKYSIFKFIIQTVDRNFSFLNTSFSFFFKLEEKIHDSFLILKFFWIFFWVDCPKYWEYKRFCFFYVFQIWKSNGRTLLLKQTIFSKNFNK